MKFINDNARCICVKTNLDEVIILEHCLEEKKNNKRIIYDFFETDVQFDYYDIKVSANPKITLDNYKKFVERYKERLSTTVRVLHFSNDFWKGEHEPSPVWKADYFWNILEELLTVKSPVMVEINNKVKEYMSYSIEYEKIKSILQQHDHVIGFHFFENLHYYNEDEQYWESYSNVGKDVYRWGLIKEVYYEIESKGQSTHSS